MAKRTVFESTNMGSTHYAERIFDAVADVDIENGTFGYLEGLAEGKDVIYNFKAGTKDGETVVVVDNPVWTEDNCRITNQRKDKFVIEAGIPFRVRVIKKNDTFAISIEGFTTETQAVVTETTDFTETDVYATIDNTTGKLVAATAPVEGATMVAKIEGKRLSGNSLTSVGGTTYGYSRTMYRTRVTTLV